MAYRFMRKREDKAVTVTDASGNVFSPAIYRDYNLDLRHLGDDDLVAHFAAFQHEPRIFGPTTSTADFLSMRWLRGSGLEVGAGPYPTNTFGTSNIQQTDVDIGLRYRGKKLDSYVSVDDPYFLHMREDRFDFAVASHVLEHCDGFIRAVENLVRSVRRGGIVYIVLPDIEFLFDQNWMPYFNMGHHLKEYQNRLLNADIHDDAYIKARLSSIAHADPFADLPSDYQEMLKNGKIPAEYRFLHHKHNYTFGDWLEIIAESRKFLHRRFDIVETRYGHERKDCHFVLRRTESTN